MKKSSYVIASAALAGSLVAGLVSPAPALTNPALGGARSTVLATLVAEGVLTQVQADAIRVAKKPLRKEWASARRAALAQLVANGTLTAVQSKKIARMGKQVRRGQLIRRLGLSVAQASDVISALRIAKATSITARLNLIATLVTQGTITDAQAQAYIAALVARRA